MIKPTTYDLLTVLRANPHQEQSAVWTSDYKGWLILTTQNIVLYCDGDKWWWHYCDGFNPPTQDVVNPTQFTSLDTKDVHAEIDRVLNIARQTHTPSSTMQETVSTEQTFVSTDRYRELEAELAKSKDQVYWLSLIGGLYGLSVSNPSKIHEQACKTYNRVSSAGTHVDSLRSQLKAMTASRDEAQKKNDFINGQMSDLLAERDGLFVKIKGLTVENERLKSKADHAGLLSVVCRRLCGDENATAETVHAAIDLCHDQANTIDFIGERVGSDPDTTIPNRFSEIRSLLAQTVKSLGEKTVENAKLQEGLKNYKAHVEGLTKRLEQMTFERDTERIGNKWLSETVEDLKRTTVKLPNEHTLRRLFNRHNTPDKYDNGTEIPTIERFLLIIENLCRNADCAERRFEELNAISTRVHGESEDAHATLDEMSVPRWTTANNHNERYLSLSARIRQLFQTHTKV